MLTSSLVYGVGRRLVFLLLLVVIVLLLLLHGRCRLLVLETADLLCGGLLEGLLAVDENENEDVPFASALENRK